MERGVEKGKGGEANKEKMVTNCSKWKKMSTSQPCQLSKMGTQRVLCKKKVENGSKSSIHAR